MALRVKQIGNQLIRLISLLNHQHHPAATRLISTTQPCSNSFEESMLDVLVCPLSKKPLRYDSEANELICDEINVAYPIIDGIPNLVPHDARLIKKQSPGSKTMDKTKNTSSGS